MRRTESSAPYRVAVLVCVLIGVVAVAAEGAVSASTGVLATALISVGFVVSHARRERRNIGLKAVLAVALFVAFGEFLRSVRGATSVDEARVPLAELFMWAQVLHSFDVPRRRDLNFSLASSAALVALAGSLSISTGFGAVVLAYVVAAAVALGLGHLSELRELAGPGAAAEVRSGPRTMPGPRTGSGPRTARTLARPVLTVAAAGCAATFAVFLVMPRLPGLQVRSLPFSLERRTLIPGFTGGVLNPGLRSARGGFSPKAYFGYGDFLDLRVRGRLSDETVMRVRSPEGSFWRAQVYDRYENGRWTSTDTKPDLVRATFGQTVYLPVEETPGGRDLLQTFFIEDELPNLVFHAYQAREVVSPATSVHVDRFGSIRLPFVLEPETIYSVVSYVSALGPDDLRLSGMPEVRPNDPYLQLPRDVPQRIVRLAHEITDPHPVLLDKVLAVERWLGANTRYRLDIPRDPPGRDPVDVFLFDRREGFCEQVATAMTVLLRASGIPARLATGFTQGERNPFTGLWEVRNSDAHTWVEVYYPGGGWVAYDPTHEVPDASTTGDDAFVLRPLLRFTGAIIPRPLVRAAAAVASAVRSAPAIPVAAVAVLAPLAVALGRRRRHRAPKDPRGRVSHAWLRIEAALARHGVVRSPHETADDLARKVRRVRPPGVEPGFFDALAGEFERARYGRAVPDAALFEERAASVERGLRSTRGPAFSAR